MRGRLRCDLLRLERSGVTVRVTSGRNVKASYERIGNDVKASCSKKQLDYEQPGQHRDRRLHLVRMAWRSWIKSVKSEVRKYSTQKSREGKAPLGNPTCIKSYDKYF